jgi:hypothetical protein
MRAPCHDWSPLDSIYQSLKVYSIKTSNYQSSNVVGKINFDSNVSDNDKISIDIFMLLCLENDFVSDCDLFVACVILQKQIDHINGSKENIIVPSVRMKLIREKEQNRMSSTILSIIFYLSLLETPTGEQLPLSSNVPAAERLLSQNLISQTNVKTSERSVTKEQKTEVKTSPENSSSSSNLCVLCWTEEKRLACIPCGHLATCVPCGHSLRTCPICRREIEAFVRIYI